MRNKKEPFNIFQFIDNLKNKGEPIVDVSEKYMEYLEIHWSEKITKEQIWDLYNEAICEIKKHMEK